MERRLNRILVITICTSLFVGVLPVVPIGEAFAPEHASQSLASESGRSVTGVRVSPVADATTLEKLRHLFTR